MELNCLFRGWRWWRWGLGCGLLLAVMPAGALDVIVAERTGADIQSAIDAVAMDGGGRVTLLAGEYLSGTLYLRNRVELHLDQGAVLRGATSPDGYDDIVDQRIGQSPERSNKAFLVALDCEDVAITGEGTIDCNGPQFYDTSVPPPWHYGKPALPRPRLFQAFNCRRLRLAGVTMKDSPGWTCWLRRCTDVTVSGLKIEGDQRMINNDGLHFDGCCRVRVGDSTLRTGDDCLVVRANPDADGEPQLSEDVVVSNCTLNSTCSAVRLGCPSDTTIRNVRFQRLKLAGATGVCSVHPLRYLHRGERGSCRLEDIVFEDCEFDTYGPGLALAVDEGVQLSAFGNISLRNCHIKSKVPLTLKGNSLTPLKNLKFENCRLEIAAVEPLDLQAVEDLDFSGTIIRSGLPKKSNFNWKWESDSWEAGTP